MTFKMLDLKLYSSISDPVANGFMGTTLFIQIKHIIQSSARNWIVEIYMMDPT